jgi:hypothetical protein
LNSSPPNRIAGTTIDPVWTPGRKAMGADFCFPPKFWRGDTLKLATVAQAEL